MTTFKPFKARYLYPGRAVRIYRNLQRDCFSVMQRQEGKWRVIGHCDQACLGEASFHVGRAGWAKVRETGKKQVHAWVAGKWKEWSEVPEWAPQVRYNPLRDRAFMRDDEAIYWSSHVWLTHPNVFVNKVKY